MSTKLKCFKLRFSAISWSFILHTTAYFIKLLVEIIWTVFSYLYWALGSGHAHVIKVWRNPCPVLHFFFFFAILAISLDQQANFPVLSVQIIPFLHCSALLTSLSHSLRGHLVLRRHSNFLLRDTNKPFSQEMFWHYFML